MGVELQGALPDRWRGPLQLLIKAASIENFGKTFREHESTNAAIDVFFSKLSESVLELFSSIDGSTFDDGTPNAEQYKKIVDQELSALAGPIGDRLRVLIRAALDYVAGFSMLLLAQEDEELGNTNQQLAKELLEEAGACPPSSRFDSSLLRERLGELDCRTKGAEALELQRSELIEAVLQFWAVQIGQALRE